jgi:hypothetical protein
MRKRREEDKHTQIKDKRRQFNHLYNNKNKRNNHDLLYIVSRASVVGIVTGYGLDDREIGVPSPRRVSTSCIPAVGPTQPPIQRAPWALSSGLKRPGREPDHLPLTSAEIKKMWSYTSTPPYVFME